MNHPKVPIKYILTRLNSVIIDGQLVLDPSICKDTVVVDNLSLIEKK